MLEVARARRDSYRRRVAVVAAAAAAVLVATGFGAYALTRDEPTHVDSVGCYAEATLEADLAVIENTAQDPVAACAELWRAGTMQPGTAVPPLQACVLETRRRWPSIPPGAPRSATRSGSPVSRMPHGPSSGGSGRCTPRSRSGWAPPRARGGRGRRAPTRPRRAGIARAELDARGFASWTVETSGTFTRGQLPVPVDRTRPPRRPGDRDCR